MKTTTITLPSSITMTGQIIKESDIMEFLGIDKVEASDVERYCDRVYAAHDSSTIEFDRPYVHVMATYAS